MRVLVLSAVLVSCAPAQAVQPTDDPRVAEFAAELRSAQEANARLAAQVATGDGMSFLMFGNTQTTLAAGGYTAIGLPDTFTVHIAFTSTQPIRPRIMDVVQYGRWAGGKTFDARVYPAAPDFDLVFHDSEGCSTYLLLLENTGSQEAVVTPNIVITRAPSPVRTGACAN